MSVALSLALAGMLCVLISVAVCIAKNSEKAFKFALVGGVLVFIGGLIVLINSLMLGGI